MIKRKTKIKSPRELTVTFNPMRGFNYGVAPEAGGEAYAQTMENLVVSDGTLVPCDGFKPHYEYVYNLKIIRKIYLYKRFDSNGNADNRIIIYCSDKYLYECALGGGTFQKITDVQFDSDPSGVLYNYNGENVMIFSKSGGGLCIYNGTEMTFVPEAPEITSMCLHFERLFVTTGGNDNSLWFSDDFDPANWNVSLSEAGFIDMNDFRGDLIKVVSFGDYLYVFRTFGITRISAYTDQRQFSATNLFVSSGRIFADSIIVCGDCMLFAATDGIYRFDGVSTQKISGAFDKKFNPAYKGYKGLYYNGYAYIRVSSDLDGTYVVRLLRINPKTLDASFICGAIMADFAIVDVDGVYKLYGAEAVSRMIGEFTPDDPLILKGKPMQIWENGESDFGVPTEKTLKRFSCYSAKPVKITITADGTPHVYNADGGVKPVVLRPNIKGVKFKIRFDASDVATKIASPEMKMEYYL